MNYTSYKQLMSDYNKGLIDLDDLFILKDEHDRHLKEFDIRIKERTLLSPDEIMEIHTEVYGE